MNEKIIDKVKKLLALAGNNPNKNEAEEAALQAQRLLSKYNISVSEIKEEKDEVTSVTEVVGNGKAWKYSLAKVIADNFRCKTFSLGSSIIAFYGNETDAQVCKEIFRFLFKYGDKQACAYKRVYLSTHLDGKNIYNSFIYGYITGIKDKLDSQAKALMIIIPKEVEESYKEFSKDFKPAKERKVSVYNKTYLKGYKVGQEAMARRELSC